MSLFKTYPNFFTNGKFKVKDSFNNNIRTIDGINGDDFILSQNNLTDSGLEVSIKDCTLIARKIKDMNYGEIAKGMRLQTDAFDGRDFLYWKNCLIEICSGGGEYCTDDLKAGVQNYLLSIGVYPGDQTDFGKDVIDINTI